MYYLYNIAVLTTNFLLKIVAVFNNKIKLFVSGRKEVFQRLQATISNSDSVIWFHCASLGEFEQARPIIEKFKRSDTGGQEIKILVTFFSPSGYEIRKDYDLADVVCYLPLDTQSNAKKFVNLANPNAAIFVKYEFWPNLLRELKRKNIKTILISGIFRKNQAFFRGYGTWMRKPLKTFDHFFVQDSRSEKLLRSIGLTNITISGDTRFDRVSDIVNQDNSVQNIHKFKNNKHMLVAGSTWPEDEVILIDYINNEASEGEKFIIAPHTINNKEIEKLRGSFNKKNALYSDSDEKSIQEAQILIIDSIGILTKVYSYADVAYVGGGFKTGLHNILEPSAYGMPIIIGPKYQKFNEARELVDQGGCVAVSSQGEFNAILKKLYEDERLLSEKAGISKNYVKNNIGASDHVLNYLIKQL